jgi:hypothetical protein
MRAASVLALLILCLANFPAGAAADGMALALSRLSEGGCAQTASDAQDFSLVRSDGSPQLQTDKKAYTALASALLPLAFSPLYAPLSNAGARGFAFSIDGQVIRLEPAQAALRRGTQGAGPRSCDGRNTQVAGALFANRLRVEKGLPLGLSVGAHAGRVHDAGLYVAGAHGKVGLVEGYASRWVPDVALRLASTAIGGNAALSLFAWQLDLMASKGFVAGRLRVAPYLGASVLAVRASTLHVDLTPNIDALACARGTDAVCNAQGLGASDADQAHDRRFPTLWLGRARITAGAMLRYGMLALLLEGGADFVPPGRLNAVLADSTPRQWHVSLAPTLAY